MAFPQLKNFLTASNLCLLVFCIVPSYAGSHQPEPDSIRYLAFQIFTSGEVETAETRLHFPPLEDLQKTVEDIRARISIPSSENRKLGFIPGPLSFDNTDEEIHELITLSFDIALKSDMAVGFHIDDSMFWGRLANLNKPSNIEWLDWNQTLNTGRRLDWSSTPTKIRPQLCLNSTAVMDEVKKRAGLIGQEIQKGLKKLDAAGKGDLFIGVIAGWETQIGKDFNSGKPLGYCAMTNKGFSAKKPPGDFDRARSDIVQEFVSFWANSLAEAGVPKEKIYSHVAFISETMFELFKRARPAQAPASYLQATNATPPDVAFGNFNHPGFSTYPQPGFLEQLQGALEKHGNPSWASCEGTAMDPSTAESGGTGIDMEVYLGNMFNHGAQLVNIFGWRVGDQNNPFSRVAEAADSIAAYRKFLSGEKLKEAPIPIPDIPSTELPKKIQQIQQALPAYIDKHGPDRVLPLMQQLEAQMKQQKLQDVEKTADKVLQLLRGE